MERSIWDLSFVVTPIFITRLVDDTGGIMTGGAAQVGIPCVAMATRSVTSCRAANSSAPRSRIAVTEDSCATELERRISTPGTPFIAFSIGTVTCASTSAGDSPRQRVWTSTLAGANSGKTSIGISRSRWAPKKVRPRPNATTMKRKCRLFPTIQRIMTSASRWLFAVDAHLCAVKFGHPLRDDSRSGRRTVGKGGVVSVDPLDHDSDSSSIFEHSARPPRRETVHQAASAINGPVVAAIAAANRGYKAGSTNSAKIAELTKPPRITTAAG